MRLKHYLDISNAQDLPELEAGLVSFAHRLDFGIISGSAVIAPSNGPVAVTHFGNTPEAFFSQYSSQLIGKRDPVLQRMKRSTLPFTYDQQMYLEAGAADLWDYQAAFGYRTGITACMHLPAGKYMWLGIDREKSLPDDESAVARMMADLQLLTAHALEAAERLVWPKMVVEQANHQLTESPTQDARSNLLGLTHRELEALKWTLIGKTAWEVGALLNIAESTAARHIHNAMRKLGCVNKHQAALKAARHGLIPLG